MIAFLIADLDVRGGTHKQFLELLNYADGIGEDFVVITKKLDLSRTYPGFSRYADKIKLIHDMPPMRWWKRIPWGWMRYNQYVRGLLSGVDVVNIHDCGFEHFLKFCYFKRVIWQINDLHPSFREGVFKRYSVSRADQKERRRIRFWTRLMVNRITVNVGKNAERVKRQLGMDAEVLYCGITPISLEHDNEATFGRFREKKIRLLSSGVFFPYRNYETLVGAVDVLCQRGIDVSLNIFGTYRYSPDYYEKIIRIIESKGLSSRIKILGEIDEDEYRRLHADSDAFCFVNVDQSWGLAVFEAMSAGLPVVVSKSVGATEILHDGSDATFVDPMSAEGIANAILSLMDNPNDYERIQRAGIELVKRYSWEDAYCRPLMRILKDC